MLVNQFFDKEELNLLLDNSFIQIDTREQKNNHITSFWDKYNVKYCKKALNSGDYGIFINPVPELNIHKRIYIPVAIERKANIDELAGNFKERARFENEFMRAKLKGIKMYMFIEDLNGYENLIKGNYRSEYSPKALLGSLKAFEARYGINVKFIKKELAGHEIAKTLEYETKEYFMR